MSRVRLGIIGAGGIVARLHLPDLEKNPNFEVRLISGRKKHRLEYLCQRFHIPHYTHNYEDVIADDSIDAVIVATPHPLHVPWGLKAIEAGKHVLMQKPLTGDMEEANQFVAACEKTDRTVLCMPHFSNAIYTLRKLCREGAIGKVSGARFRTSHGGPEIYYAEIRDIFGEKDDDLWFFDAKRASVGALFDMGVYAVSNFVGMLGTAKRVMAMVTTFDKPTELEDEATLILEMENGGLATCETSWCDPARTYEFSVHGTAGKFTSNGGEVIKHTPTSYTREHAPIHREPVELTEGVGGLHEHFYDCIQQGVHPPLENAWTARHVTEILLAALESGRTGRAVELKTTAEVPS
ncbi:MAG: dehydrogenase [Candidatus Poribacteria bacterium]|nr:MAG: dehydrogenase [Candidatus Poribacteria bacterium]